MAGSEKKLNIRQILKYTALSVVAIAIIGTVLMNKVRINELGSNLSAEQAKLQEAEQKYSQLSMEARAKVNIRDVEAYAVNELGMQLPEGYQVETISLSEGDKTVIHQDEGTDDGQDMTKEWSEIKIAATNILAYLD